MTNIEQSNGHDRFHLADLLSQIKGMLKTPGESALLIPKQAAADLFFQVDDLLYERMLRNEHFQLMTFCRKTAQQLGIDPKIVRDCILSIIKGRKEGLSDMASCNRAISKHEVNQGVKNHRALIAAANEYVYRVVCTDGRHGHASSTAAS